MSPAVKGQAVKSMAGKPQAMPTHKKRTMQDWIVVKKYSYLE